MRLKRGMIAVVNLNPVLGSETGKTRPCVIVTNDVYNQRVPIIQVIPITNYSERKAAIITNVVIVPTPENGLNKESIADCLQTRPIDVNRRLVQIIGELTDTDMNKIDSALKIVFAL